jgi:phage-related minor tail protein
VPGVNSSGGIVGALGGTSVGGAPLVGSALGNVFSAGQVIPFASGGIPDIVASPTIAPMAMFGEAGDEGILPLRRGSDGRLGVTAGGIGGAPNVIINNHTDAQPTIDRSPSGDVTVTLRRTMDAATGDSLSNGSGRRVLAQQFGLKQFTGQ